MNADLQTRIAAIKAECEEIIRLDKLAEPAPWHADTHNCEAETRDSFISCHTEGNTKLVVKARNVSPAMARVVLWSIRDAEMKCDNFLLRCIANQWEGK